MGLTSAFLIAIVLHEVSHYLMSIGLGYEAELFHNRVETEKLGNPTHEILIAGIGPVFSLIQGLIAYYYSKKMKTSPTSLFVLWFGLAGIITFFGYLLIAPLIPVGDTGKVFKLLNIPMYAQIICSVIAITLVTIFLIKSSKEFEKYAVEDFGSLRTNRKKWSFSLILFPMLISILLITLFQFPIPHFASIIASICTPFSIIAVFATFIDGKKAINMNLDGRSINQDISKTLVIIFVLAIIVNRTLVYGV